MQIYLSGCRICGHFCLIKIYHFLLAFDIKSIILALPMRGKPFGGWPGPEGVPEKPRRDAPEP